MGKCLPLWGKVAEALTEADEGKLAATSRERVAGERLPSSVTFGDSFPLWGSL